MSPLLSFNSCAGSGSLFVASQTCVSSSRTFPRRFHGFLFSFSSLCIPSESLTHSIPSLFCPFFTSHSSFSGSWSLPTRRSRRSTRRRSPSTRCIWPSARRRSHSTHFYCTCWEDVQVGGSDPTKGIWSMKETFFVILIFVIRNPALSYISKRTRVRNFKSFSPEIMFVYCRRRHFRRRHCCKSHMKNITAFHAHMKIIMINQTMAVMAADFYLLLRSTLGLWQTYDGPAKVSLPPLILLSLSPSRNQSWLWTSRNAPSPHPSLIPCACCSSGSRFYFSARDSTRRGTIRSTRTTRRPSCSKCSAESWSVGWKVAGIKDFPNASSVGTNSDNLPITFFDLITKSVDRRAL